MDQNNAAGSGAPNLILSYDHPPNLSSCSARTQIGEPQKTEISFFVGTSSLRNGSLDLSHVQHVCSGIRRGTSSERDSHWVALRTTVLPGTTKSVVAPVPLLGAILPTKAVAPPYPGRGAENMAAVNVMATKREQGSCSPGSTALLITS